MAVPVARRQQLVWGRHDVQLTRLARQHTPGISNWWGRRFKHGRNGAWCYICEHFVATWSSRSPITVEARQVLHEHRVWHIGRLLDGRPPEQEIAQ